MAKLNCYCINSVARYYDMMFLFMNRKSYLRISYEQWSKLRMHIMYAFEDRYDDGYNIDIMIKALSKTKYRFAYEFLNRLKNTSFENHKVTKISSTLVISLMGAKKTDSKVYLKRYYVKQFKAVKKLYSKYSGI